MPAVDVIIPVHGAPRELDRCIAAVLACTKWRDRRLVVVDDADPEFPAAEALDRLAAARGAPFLLLRNRERLGFVGSVNRAMAASQHDVVLLNSDTEVTPGWLDKLERAAYSAPTVGTVTPFSNHATICSLPRWLDANLLPAGFTADSFAALVERVSRREYPRLPTGVGVCLYIKREVLERVGLFDETRFDLGYGEESEFCMRAGKAGYEHVLDDATFIYHAGQRSFGLSRAARVRRAERQMRALHPDYAGRIARFLRDDPLRPVRERVVAALAPDRREARSAPPLRVLHVVHGWPPHNLAGTEIYARGLALRQVEQREVFAYARISDPLRRLGDASELHDHGIRVRLMVNDFTARSPLARNSLRSRVLEHDFARFLDETRPDLVHVHHLAGLAIGILRQAVRRRIPIVHQLQDWWALCARSNLLDHHRRPCSGPALAKCSACLPLTKQPPAPLWNRALYAYRRALARHALAAADAIVAGSRCVVESHRREGLLGADADVHVLPYGIEPARQPAPTRDPVAHPIRFGFIGSIQPHKGLHVLFEAFRGVDPSRARLDVFGDATIDAAYAAELTRGAPPAATMHGRFAEADKDEIFRALDVLVVPSLGLESFGLVVREALARGVAVLLSRRGALAEVDEISDPLAFFEPGNADELRARIERLIAHPEDVARQLSGAARIRSIEEHAQQVEDVYAAVCARRRHG